MITSDKRISVTRSVITTYKNNLEDRLNNLSNRYEKLYARRLEMCVSPAFSDEDIERIEILILRCEKMERATKNRIRCLDNALNALLDHDLAKMYTRSQMTVTV